VLGLALELNFIKRRQKLCLNLLIKKKRIAQLINGKLGKNVTTKPQDNKPKACDLKTNKHTQPTTTTN
jgi:hypothetical protein